VSDQQIFDAVERGRIAGVKEFAERLRSRLTGVGVHNAIDCVEKEMVGGKGD
jgi:hypothetical protein